MSSTKKGQSRLTNSYSYQKAGVDIDAGHALIRAIAPLAASTARAGTSASLGGFGGLFDMASLEYCDPILVLATDGVGTKLKLATATGQNNTIGVDLVAMCVNDLIVQGAEPLCFLDYFATAHLDIKQATQIIEGIAVGCREAGCALIGGETAEMPGHYQSGDYDLAGFALGVVEREAVLPRDDIAEGDILLGLASSGVHANGFSLVHQLIEDNAYRYDDPFPLDPSQNIGECLLTPTRIYVRSLLAALQHKDASMFKGIKAMAHITGGGLIDNIARFLPDTIQAHVDGTTWPLPPIFRWLSDLGGLPDMEMAHTFNCGLGMVVVVPASQEDTLKNHFESFGETVWTIGTFVSRMPEEAPVIITGSPGSAP
ncbi:MAG: phosphoribosylformylglycinamidine cyclo-ligase [Parvularculales bacterium]